jgi:hypothetical protein
MSSISYLHVCLSQPPKLGSGGAVAPTDRSALVLHRQVRTGAMAWWLYRGLQGFTSCYRPLGMSCATNGGKISIDELFPELYRFVTFLRVSIEFPDSVCRFLVCPPPDFRTCCLYVGSTCCQCIFDHSSKIGTWESKMGKYASPART